MQTLTKADLLAESIRKYTDHYRDRLIAIYILPDHPYEPEGDEGTLHLVLVLKEPYQHFSETDPVADIADEVARKYDFRWNVLAHHTSAKGELAERAAAEGVRL